MKLEDAVDFRLGSQQISFATENSTQFTFWCALAITISRILSGAKKLVKKDGGVLTLSASNTFNGGIDINSGTLATANANGLSTSGNITFLGGALQLDVSITGLTSRIKNSTSPIILAVNVATSQSGVIDSTNTAGLTKRGTNTLTLTANNTFSGPIRVELGNLTLQGTNASVTEARILGGPSVQNSGGQALGSYVNTPFGSATLYSELKSAGSIPDFFALNSTTTALSFSNPIVLDITNGRAGVTAYGTKGVTISSPITVIGTGSQQQTTTSSATTNSNHLPLNSIPATFVVGAYISGIGLPIPTRITAINGLTVTIDQTASVASGATIIAGSGDIVFQNSQSAGSNALMAISSAISAPNMVGNFSLRGSAVGCDGVFTGSLYAPNGGLAHNGINVWTIFKNALNNYARLQLQNTASSSQCKLGESDALPSQTLISWSSGCQTGLNLNGFNQTCAGLTGTSGSANLVNLLTNTGAAATLTFSALSATRSFYGTISGPINLVMNSASRTQALYGSNGHTGSTTISAGTLFIGSLVSGPSAKFTSASFTASTLTATFVSGNAPVTGEQYKLLTGATTNTYSSVSLVNGGGKSATYDSPSSTLTIIDPLPVITQNLPTSYVHTNGSILSVAFTVVASGTGLTYAFKVARWANNLVTETVLQTGSSNSLTLYPSKGVDAGTGQVINRRFAVGSSIGTPFISCPPAAGDNFTLSADLQGYNYFWCEVSNASGTVVSNNCFLTSTF